MNAVETFYVTISSNSGIEVFEDEARTKPMKEFVLNVPSKKVIDHMKEEYEKNGNKLSKKWVLHYEETRRQDSHKFSDSAENFKVFNGIDKVE